MKKIRKNKADTRSGFGALGLGLILFALVVVASCYKYRPEKEPKSDTPVIQYIVEYSFEDEFFCDTLYSKYSGFYYAHWFFPTFVPHFYGVKYMEETEGHCVKLYGIDYNKLSCSVGFEIHDYDALKNRGFTVNYIRFRFAGDGIGPFHEGVEYSWPEGAVLENAYIISDERLTDEVLLISMKWKQGVGTPGLEFKVLSSSFKFAYSEIEDEYVRDVLDVFFDFELVVVNASEDEGAEIYPNVGDTIRVKNGHFVQSLFCYDTDFLHQLIVPNEENN